MPSLEKGAHVPVRIDFAAGTARIELTVQANSYAANRRLGQTDSLGAADFADDAAANSSHGDSKTLLAG